MNTMTLTAVRAYSTVKSTLALVGLAALCGLAFIPTPREALLKHLPPLSAFLISEEALSTTTAAGLIQAGAIDGAREQRAVTEYIARRYRVSDQAVASFVATAYRAGSEYSLDPLLILAVVAVESRYNPVAESDLGARGLMQIIPKYHLKKLADHGGEQSLLDPYVNIMVGSQILREYQRRLGDTEAALQMYGGAFDEPTSQYANKVLAEKARLELLRQKAKEKTV